MEPAAGQKKRRGRPAGKTADTRERIIDAAREVYGEHGTYGTTVALILKQAQVSRPTFYKYFSSAVDVIDEVVRQCNQEVEQLFVRIFEQPQKEFYDYLPMALSGYLNWGRSQGLLMEARFRELHDRSSPVSRYRDEHNRRIASTLHSSMVRHGRTPPDDLALTSLVQGIEHLGYQFCMQAEHTEMPRYIEVMGRLCIAMLGNRHDWQEMMASPFFSRLLGLEENESETGS
ncbi:TetR/AcrR family transcriptional regulator [Alcanivorax sp. NBRC 102024]|uniref:TetR/AcrR family transcriptional regulator n=1 Tax=Alcanivorax sp. NBRC 102024 TaxID=1113895 RepID=UPI000789D72E|nr:TetR/AcrR family transcriptional regulator [Alcanivorax sp. NBRC 102024]